MSNDRQKAFVTGGSRGIGRGIIKVLSDNGYDIAFTYNTKEEEAKSLKEEVEQKGLRCFYYQASLEQPETPTVVTKQAIKDLGGIHLLVANAGLTRFNSLLTVDAEQIDFLYGLNYRSYILCAKEAANDMIEKNVKGNIIFITSTRGYRAYTNDCLYGSFKAALIRGAESMALEMSAYGIRVNCVAPGATAVRGEDLSAGSFPKKIPLGRKGSPEEVGFLVNFIASPQSSYMTGNTIKLDGGLILPGMPEV